MINIINPNYNINSYFNKFASRPSFKADSADVFIKNKNGEKPLMSFESDQQKSILINLFDKKTRVLPMGMDGVMSVVGQYLKGNINAADFSSLYLNRTPALLKRIELGADKEEYLQSYKPEIALIKAISPICDNYINNGISEDELNSFVQKIAEKYTSVDHKRTKHFIK